MAPGTALTRGAPRSTGAPCSSAFNAATTGWKDSTGLVGLIGMGRATGTATLDVDGIFDLAGIGSTPVTSSCTLLFLRPKRKVIDPKKRMSAPRPSIQPTVAASSLRYAAKYLLFTYSSYTHNKRNVLMAAWNRIMDLAELEKLFQKPCLATTV